MVYGPLGSQNMQALCMMDGICQKKLSKRIFRCNINYIADN